MLAGFDLLTLHVEHTIETKVMALRQLIQWSGYPAVVLLQETGVLPPRFVFHCLYWHTFTVVTSSSASVTILVRRDSQLHIGDFVHHPKGRAIVLELVYKGTPVQVVNVYMLAKGTAKEYRPLLQWLCAHVAPDSRLVLMGEDFQCNPGWSADCVFVNTEIAPALSEFVADMALLPFTHGMCGPTWVNAQVFVGALDFFLSRRVSPEIGTVPVENGSAFPSDHYPVRLCLHTLPALVPPRNPASRARFNLGTNVCSNQRPLRMAALASVHSLRLPRRKHISIRERPDCSSRSGFQTTEYPGYCPSSVCGGACPTCFAPSASPLLANRTLVCKVIAARKAVRQAWDVVGLERSLEVLPLAPPGGGGVKGPAKSDYRCLLRKPYTARIKPTYVSGRLVPPEVQAAVGLDQFHARHLRPILRYTREELYTIVPWRVAVMPSLVVTIDSVKDVLRKARKSTPFCDVIESCMIEWLCDEEFQWVVEFLLSVSTGVPLRALVHGDFYALPAKVPHGPIVNARPLLNFYHHVEACRGTHSRPLRTTPGSGWAVAMHPVRVACFL